MGTREERRGQKGRGNCDGVVVRKLGVMCKLSKRRWERGTRLKQSVDMGQGRECERGIWRGAGEVGARGKFW